MKIYLHTARNIIAITWISLSFILILLVFTQTILGKYGVGLAALSGIGWAVQCTVPIGGLMVGTLGILHHKRIKNVVIDNNFLFYFSLILVFFYFLSIVYIYLAQPTTRLTSDNLFMVSSIFVGAFQGVVMTIVSKFFIEWPTS